MGLFRKKTGDAEQIATLKAEMVTLRERLDDADRHKTELLAKIDTVDQSSTALNQRVDSLDTTNAALDERVGSVGSQVTAAATQHAGTVSELSAQVEKLAERLTTSKPQVPPPPPAAVVDPRVDELASRLGDLDAFQERITELACNVETLQVSASGKDESQTAQDTAPDTEELDELRSQMAEITDKMQTIDSRMTNVSIELANQLTELSNDLELLIDQPDAPLHDVNQLQLELEGRVDDQVDKAMGEIQISTERLAQEQARYEIKFREDLAELADRLRRPQTR
jgi:chromosome segregation ATPase